jgi:hypothetical protein
LGDGNWADADIAAHYHGATLASLMTIQTDVRQQLDIFDIRDER